MNTYEERKQARLGRYKEYARNAKQRSEVAYNKAHQIADFIPFGQPILVGHHSEGRHRSDLKRIDNNMRKSIEEDGKSDYWQHRAEAAEKNTAISYKDPEAIEKLKRTIAEMEKFQLQFRGANKALRQAKILPSDPEATVKMQRLGLSGYLIKEAFSCNKHSFTGKEYLILPGWMLSNYNNNLRRYRERLTHMEHMTEKLQHFEEVKTDKGEIVKNEEFNGIEIHFPGKPEQEIIDKLKSHGFKWSGRSKCWYHKYSDYALQAAQEIIQ